MELLFWLGLMVFILFRRRILTPLTGPVYYWLFEAVLWTSWSAWAMANIGAMGIINVVFGIMALVCGAFSMWVFIQKSREAAAAKSAEKSNG